MLSPGPPDAILALTLNIWYAIVWNDSIYPVSEMLETPSRRATEPRIRAASSRGRLLAPMDQK